MAAHYMNVLPAELALASTRNAERLFGLPARLACQ